MKILVIPDVHLKPHIFDLADTIDTKLYDNIVCLGDLVDDFGQKNNKELYEETLKRAIKFGLDHKESLWCYGNHDISYMYGLNETGFSIHMMDIVNYYLNIMEEEFDTRLAVMHKIDKCLFSHAGLSKWFVESNFISAMGMDGMISWINDWVKSYPMVLQKLWKDDSPIWLRFQEPYGSPLSLYDPEHWCQCVGHTPSKEPFVVNNALTVDNFSTYANGDKFGDERLIILNTDNMFFEYVT